MPVTATVNKKRKISKRAKTFSKRMGWAKKKTTTSTAAVRSIVRQELNKDKEKKFMNYRNTGDLVNAANTGAWANNTIVLSPYTGYVPITQGTGTSNRIGDKVKITKGVCRLVITPKNYNVGSNDVPMPQVIEGFIWSPLSVSNDPASALTITTNNFFEYGNSSLGIQGTLKDTVMLTNTETVKLHSRFRMMVGAAGYTLNDGAQDNYYNYTNNQFDLVGIKVLDFTKYLDKEYIFYDNNGTARNTPLYLTLSPMDSDGGANASTTGAAPDEWTWSINYEFTDA